VISSHDFLFFLLITKCFFLYTSCVPRVLYAFNDILITLKGKIKYCVPSGSSLRASIRVCFCLFVSFKSIYV
jgi:hypothetical protein